jgi:hypothetical protein
MVMDQKGMIGGKLRGGCGLRAGFYPYPQPQGRPRPTIPFDSRGPRAFATSPPDRKPICLSWSPRQTTGRHREAGEPHQTAGRPPQRLPGPARPQTLLCLHAGLFRPGGPLYLAEAPYSYEPDHDNGECPFTGCSLKKSSQSGRGYVKPRHKKWLT